VEFLGRVVGTRGMHIGPGYIKDIEDWPRPKNKKEVERFWGSPTTIGSISINSNPTDLSDASVSSIKGSVALGRARTGALTIAFLNSSNALSCSSPH
jgi:hypothetical protein